MKFKSLADIERHLLQLASDIGEFMSNNTEYDPFEKWVEIKQQIFQMEMEAVSICYNLQLDKEEKKSVSQKIDKLIDEKSKRNKDILELLKQGKTPIEISKEFPLHVSSIRDLKNKFIQQGLLEKKEKKNENS